MLWGEILFIKIELSWCWHVEVLKTPILVLLLDLLEPILLSVNITGIKTHVLTVKHPFEKDGKFIEDISGLKHIYNSEIWPQLLIIAWNHKEHTLITRLMALDFITPY